MKHKARQEKIYALFIELIHKENKFKDIDLDTRPVEVSAEVKCSLNVSQTGPVGELGKAHHHELVTTVELDVVPVALVAVDTLLEFIFVEERHDLSEDRFSFVHGLRMAS